VTRTALVRRAAPLVALLALANVPAVGAQALAFKRDAGAATTVRCAEVPAPARPSTEARAQAERLTTLAHEAAIAGDDRAARDLFAQAAAADPSDASLAYYLGRAHESLGEADAAARQYCRFLALAPTGSDAPDVRDRLARLAPTVGALSEPASSLFSRGVEHYDQRRYDDAVRAFSGVIERAPSFEAAYYDRALASMAAGKPERAVGDLERYLELAPDAADRVAVGRQLTELRRQALSPTTALLAGVIPGIGQFYTRRPLRGLLVLAGVGAAAYLGTRTETRTHTETFTDPFGNELEYEVSERVRPNLTVGVAAAAGLTAAAAIEAFLYARRVRSSASPTAVVPTTTRERSTAPLVEPGPRGSLRMGMRLSFGGS
jgi:tetratricopeptide (TPR) repeat protein